MHPQEQKVEYDEEAIRDQIVTTIRNIKVVEWLKDNIKRTIKPMAAPAASEAMK